MVCTLIHRAHEAVHVFRLGYSKIRKRPLFKFEWWCHSLWSVVKCRKLWLLKHLVRYVKTWMNYIAHVLQRISIRICISPICQIPRLIWDLNHQKVALYSSWQLTMKCSCLHGQNKTEWSILLITWHGNNYVVGTDIWNFFVFLISDAIN